MKKITMKEFEELIAKDEALTAKAKEITGEGDDLKKKISAFAASLGYELDLMPKLKALSDDEMENIYGGVGSYDGCRRGDHDWILVTRFKGIFWGYNAAYRCSRCNKEKFVWE